LYPRDACLDPLSFRLGQMLWVRRIAFACVVVAVVVANVVIRSVVDRNGGGIGTCRGGGGEGGRHVDLLC